MTFTESLTAHFPDAIPANQFVSGSQRALARIGVHRGGALPMIATCRDELAFALTAELQRAWGGAFNMAGLAGLFTLGRTGVIAARGHAPLIDGRRTFLVFGLAHIGVDEDGELGQVQRPGYPASRTPAAPCSPSPTNCAATTCASRTIRTWTRTTRSSPGCATGSRRGCRPGTRTCSPSPGSPGS